MKLSKHLKSIFAFSLFFLIVSYIILANPCTNSLFIYACKYMKLVVVIYIAIAIANFIVLSTILYLFKLKKIVKINNIKLFIIYLTLIVIAFAMSLLELRILYLFSNKIPAAQINSEDNINQTKYKISDFNEKIVKLENGNSAIDVSFKLTIDKTGSYGGTVKILSPDEKTPVSVKTIFGDINKSRFDKLSIINNKEKDMEMKLEPTKLLQDTKTDGPYYITINIFPEGNSKSNNYDFGVIFTGNPEFKDYKDIFSTCIYEEKLVTKAYKYTDFIK